ncbi:3-methyladenine DNA glycosylase [Pseudarthrobacter sp. J75]|uniref:DNA-3-methyladenine glycosylase family protein n=1 Tax=unclassified Pseudarthrobacter TaxID=2647000 RepID=UPI002E820951|nr:MULTISPECIES: 3-methyladenine DNA glycosylase [unclassified Pseudarthrobacter]MEE2523926.1 3-methyladenine DNA glycosylase [Pseudarthrobacter sp. J47]MEE2528313.1 3-methyladenine DNA glycosylase [Pseudarthrobacter sp. J75]MEE2568008.1 3-methyladenine DNA glycosylase [Pseudarthrobacter sp. J64]
MTITDAPARLAAAADASIRWHPNGPYSLAQTLGPLLRGAGDPSYSVQGTVMWSAFTTPAGPVTLRLTSAGGGSAGEAFVDAQAWGPGAESGIASVPRLLGASDDWRAFDEPAFRATLPHMVREARRRNKGIRLPSTGRVVDSLVPTILEQKVTVIEARRGYRYLMYRFGTPAPGTGVSGVPGVPGVPTGLLVQPTPDQWLRIPSWEWHKAGVGPQRSATIMRALRSAVALERLAELPAAEAAVKMQTLSGIGVWTAAEVVQRTHGCPDSIAVGDYHLAAYVGAALTGRRTDDAGMVKLLEPWNGHRQRVVRMLGLSGFRKPTFGPRMTIQDHRGH